MPGRLALVLLLVAGTLNVQAADEPEPRPLTDQQVRGLVMALDDPGVQLEALKWCAQVRAAREELFEPIRKLCQHDDPRIRNAAASAITVFGERAENVLTQLLNQPDKRLEVAIALGKMGEQAGDAVGPLTKLLADPDPDTRRVAAEALGRIGVKAGDAVGPLTKLLNDADPDTRRAAAEALGRIGEKAADAVGPLTKLLNDPEPITRRVAAEGLGRIGEKAADAVGALTKLLNDLDVDTRLATEEALVHDQATFCSRGLTGLVP
jgi:HEAT repeat protein